MNNPITSNATFVRSCTLPQQKNTPWRWVAGILAICYIVWMWVKKDVLSMCVRHMECLA